MKKQNQPKKSLESTENTQQINPKLDDRFSNKMDNKKLARKPWRQFNRKSAILVSKAVPFVGSHQFSPINPKLAGGTYHSRRYPKNFLKEPISEIKPQVSYFDLKQPLLNSSARQFDELLLV